MSEIGTLQLAVTVEKIKSQSLDYVTVHKHRALQRYRQFSRVHANTSAEVIFVDFAIEFPALIHFNKF